MRCPKLYENQQSEIKIHRLCQKYNITNYSINDDMSIDVDGDVDLNRKYLEKLPLKFNYVSGYFYCKNNDLKSLEGAPKTVGGFVCSNNKLKTLEGAPEIVGEVFYCSNNDLASLEGVPRKVGGYFNCCYNKFEDLVNILKNKGENVYYYSTHNKAIHRYGDDTIYLPMFNRLLRKLNIDEVKNIEHFTIIKTPQEGKEYLNAK